ncbi:GNAT family N-acetyltransferase [Streptomyces albireticuli]|nr:GNAT family N-acetyltransferase [Streptomyces albireticuli]MCD9194424.1 GNAT family N-acetyltransferase [Streptomyces albireticuli]
MAAAHCRTAVSPTSERTLAPPSVRVAHAADAAGLYALSEPFMRSGALLWRTPETYATTAREFLVAEDGEGVLEGCVALRAYPGDARAPVGVPAVLHNFCVRSGRQRRGVGSRLLAALLREAAARSVGEVFAATTGGGEAFVRSGFRETDAGRAPRAWAVSLDPGRGSRVFARSLTAQPTAGAGATRPRPDLRVW